MDGHMKTDNFQQAVSLFDKMIESGLEPDTITYTALVSGLCNRGHVEKAVTLLNEMSSKGMTPDVHIISALKRGIIKARKVQFHK